MSLLTDQKFLSGKSISLFQSRIKDVTELDAVSNIGAMIQSVDKLVYYSDGEKWIGLAPVLSVLFDAGNAATTYSGGASIDLGSAQS